MKTPVLRLWLVTVVLLAGLGPCATAPVAAEKPASVSSPALRDTPLASAKGHPTVFEDFQPNIRLFRLVNDNHHPVWDKIVLYSRFLGNGWVYLAVLIGLLLWTKGSGRFFLIAVAIETVVVQGMKQYFVQPRPASLLPDVHLLFPLYGKSFPSGDAAVAFVVVLTLWPRAPWLKPLLICYGLFIMYERMYLGVHFPLDVFTGAVIGAASVYVAKRIDAWLRRRTNLKSKKNGSTVIDELGG